MSLTPLPELDEDTLLRLDYPSLLSTCQINKSINEICKSEYFWKQKVDQDFGLSRFKPYGTYREQYDYLYRLPTISILSLSSPYSRRVDGVILLLHRGSQVDPYLLKTYIARDLIDLVKIIPGVTNVTVANFAAANGSRRILSWLISQGIYPNQNGINSSVVNDNSSLLEWMALHGMVPDQEGANEAVYSCAITSLNWLASRGIYPDIKKASCVDVLDWFEDNGLELNQDEIEDAYQEGDPDVIAWLERRGLAA